MRPFSIDLETGEVRVSRTKIYRMKDVQIHVGDLLVRSDDGILRPSRFDDDPDTSPPIGYAARQPDENGNVEIMLTPSGRVATMPIDQRPTPISDVVGKMFPRERIVDVEDEP